METCSAMKTVLYSLVYYITGVIKSIKRFIVSEYTWYFVLILFIRI